MGKKLVYTLKSTSNVNSVICKVNKALDGQTVGVL